MIHDFIPFLVFLFLACWVGGVRDGDDAMLSDRLADVLYLVLQ
jgi:hypothetical protein